MYCQEGHNREISVDGSIVVEYFKVSGCVRVMNTLLLNKFQHFSEFSFTLSFTAQYVAFILCINLTRIVLAIYQ